MDINDLLSSLSPEDMNNLTQLASSLMNGSGGNKAAEENRGFSGDGNSAKGGAGQSLNNSGDDFSNRSGASPLNSDLLGGVDLNSLAGFASLIGKFSNTQNDPRCNLIMSLKPLLSPEKQKRADEAIKIIHLTQLLPELRNSGLLNFSL